MKTNPKTKLLPSVRRLASIILAILATQTTIILLLGGNLELALKCILSSGALLGIMVILTRSPSRTRHQPYIIKEQDGPEIG